MVQLREVFDLNQMDLPEVGWVQSYLRCERCTVLAARASLSTPMTVVRLITDRLDFLKEYSVLQLSVITIGWVTEITP